MGKTLQLVLLLLMFTAAGAWAQNRVTGQVKDETGQPLAGANIQVKGSTAGTSANAEGRYSIEANSPDAVLVFSFLGYGKQEIPVSGRSEINVSLRPASSELEQVVVTALGIKRDKRSLGYAAVQVEADDIAGFGETNAISSLAGKAAGVNISSTTAGPTGSSRVVIRGIRELGGNSQPLYVIDGIPAVNRNIGSADQNGGFDLGDGLSDLNPNDIESISILKGASAAVLYGSRALNGVVLITTKSGKGKKGLGIEFNSSVTMDRISTKMDEVQKIYGQGSNGVVQRTALEAGNITSSWGPKYSELDQIIQRDGQMRPYKYIENNIQDFFRNGLTGMNTLALTGGNEKSSLRVSYSNTASKDIIPTSGFDRNNFLLSGETKIADKLTVRVNASLLNENVRNRPALTDEVNNIGNGLLGLAGNFDQAWLKDYANPDGSYINYTGNQYRANPYWTINRTSNDSRKNRIGASLNLDYQFSDKWSASLKGGTDFFNFDFENFYDKYTPTRDGGLLSINHINMREDNYQGMLNFNTKINKDFSISAMAGGNIMKYEQKQQIAEGTEIIVPGKKLITNFQESRLIPINPRKEVHSVFGSTTLNFKELLFLNLQARNDWSSALPAANRSYFYPGADLSLIASDAFDIKSDVLSYAKIRAAYGQVGSDTDPYKTAFLYELTGRSMHGMPMGEILGATVPNPDLKPQRKNSFEIGTDLGLFDDRLRLDFTYYNETTNDVIFDLSIPSSSGNQFASLNAAKMRNKGVEVLLSGTPVSLQNGFKWNMSVNFSKNHNTVLELYQNVETFTVAEARWAGATIIAEKGKPFGTIIGNDFVLDEQGRRVHGADGLPKFTDEPAAIGNSLPKWTGGVLNSFTYKGIELKAAIDIRAGGDIFSMTNMAMYINGSHPATVAGRDSWNQYSQERRAVQDAGGNPDDVQQNGRGYIGDGVNEAGAPNTVPVNPSTYWAAIGNNIPKQFIYDAGYVKLRDLGISYTLPKSLFKNAPFQAVSIGVIGRNLWVIHKNTPNIDPESNYNNGNGQGFEYGSLPGRKRFGFNLLIKL